MRLFVARHGDTPWNTRSIVIGHNPIGLSELGARQAAEELAPEVAALRPEPHVFVSDLRRTQQTAELACRGLSVSFTPMLRERNFGDFEGRPHAELGQAGFWEQPPDGTLGNSESLRALTLRTAAFILTLPERLPNAPETTALLITHSGPMNRLRNLERYPYDAPYVKYEHTKIYPFNFGAILHASQQLLPN